ncbi:MAG: hypothetical protein VKP62_02840 [Candidatus Sericytochromatia bacterium]|nr:hypothetical protein [Candidatus Sericytochromatia bacterium]
MDAPFEAEGTPATGPNEPRFTPAPTGDVARFVGLDLPGFETPVPVDMTSGTATETFGPSVATPAGGFRETDDAALLEPVAAYDVPENAVGRVAENDEIAGVLAPFFHKGFLARREAKSLMDPAKRAEAERRLNGIGLTLAWSPYSRYYGLALADGPGNRTERITNLAELDRNALALLVVLWARLVLPQRLAEEGREGGISEPVVSFEALNAEFGKKLGGRRFEMYVSQLKRLGFLEYVRKDEIKAGPFLDLLGDSQKLSAFLRQSTLAKVLAEQPVPEESEETTGEEMGWHAAAALAEAAAGPIVWDPVADGSDLPPHT